MLSVAALLVCCPRGLDLAVVTQDTISAVEDMCRILRVPNSRFGYCGTKDRRGVTSQIVTAHKVRRVSSVVVPCRLPWIVDVALRAQIPPERLAEVNRSSRNVLVGDVTFVDQPVTLGQLKGNQFRVRAMLVCCV